MQLSLATVVSLVATASALAAPAAAPAAEAATFWSSNAVAAEGVSPDATCAWTGYGKTNFNSKYSYGTLGGYFGDCYQMPGSAWENHLLSAKVNAGGKVCLYTSKTGCSGKHQVIDTAGYRDMTNLPAYYRWKCGAC